MAEGRGVSARDKLLVKSSRARPLKARSHKGLLASGREKNDISDHAL